MRISIAIHRVMDCVQTTCTNPLTTLSKGRFGLYIFTNKSTTSDLNIQYSALRKWFLCFRPIVVLWCLEWSI